MKRCVLCRCNAPWELHGFPVCDYHHSHGEDDPACPNCAASSAGPPIDLRSIEVFAFYLYNARPIEVFLGIYGTGQHPDYLAEKYEVLARGFHALWARLDDEHKRRFVRAAQRYADRKGFDPAEVRP